MDKIAFAIRVFSIVFALSVWGLSSAIGEVASALRGRK